jgi:segregation and condensation protein A
MPMDIQLSQDKDSSYRIKTPVYQGPLDLLLQLIENAELDITSLALAQVTDQYLKHLESIEDLAPDEISAFLVIAAKLIQIKSEALLPDKRASREEELDIGDELARQLIAYKRYREIADILDERKQLGYQSFIRLSPASVSITENLDLAGFGVKELFNLASNIFQEGIERQSINTVVERPRITIKDKINKIADQFSTTDSLTFREIIGKNYSRLDIVISFLAILELIKGHFVEVLQEKIFEDIKLKRIKEVDKMREYALKNLEL